MALIQGTFMMRPVSIRLGCNPDKNNRPEVNAELEIAEGPHAGSRIPYNGLFDDRGIKWTRLNLLALGWKGKTMSTLVSDVMNDPKMVECEVVVASWQSPSGKLREWSSVRSIGGRRDKLVEATPDTLRDVDAWMADAAKNDEEPIPF